MLGQRVSYNGSWLQMHSKLEWTIDDFFFSWVTISWNGNICLQTILGELCCSLCVWYRTLEQQKCFWGQNWNCQEGTLKTPMKDKTVNKQWFFAYYGNFRNKRTKNRRIQRKDMQSDFATTRSKIDENISHTLIKVEII